MAKKRVVTPWGESWVDDTPTPAPQKFTPIDVKTSSQVNIPKATQNLIAPQAPVQQPQQQPVASPVTNQSQQSTMPTARQDQVSTETKTTNASVQGWQGQMQAPTPTVATKDNPVRSLTIPEKQPERADLSWVTAPSTDVKSLQDYVDEWTIRAKNGEQVSPQEQLKLLQAQRELQKAQMPTMTDNPYQPQIDRQQSLRTQREQALQAQTDTLLQSETKRQQAMADKDIADQQQAGERQKQAAQSVLSFSGFGRSTFSAQQQADIQQSVERNIASIQAQKDAAVEQYRAKLNGATQQELQMYDKNIADLEQQSSEYLVELAWKIDTYNRQVNADYATKIDDIMKLSEQNAPIVPLTDAEKQQASAYAWLLVKDNGDVNQELLKLVPPKLLSEALAQGAKLKGAIWSDKTVKDANDNVFQYNPKTGKYDIPVWEKAQPKSERASMTWGWLYNKSTWEVKQVGQISSTPWQQSTNFLTQDVGTKSNYECGWYASRATGNNWTPWGNDLKARVRAFSSKEPKVGWMVLFTGWNYDKTYWHVAVVTAVNPDWTITVKESNLKWDKTITERTVPANSATWYFNNTPLAQNNWKAYDATLLPAYTAYIEQNKAPTKDQVEALWWIEKFAKDAYTAYVDNANKKLKASWFELTDPSFFSTMTPDQRKQFNNDTKTIRSTVDKLDKIIADVNTNWLPSQWFFWRWKQVKQSITDLQLQLKNEWVYNLGVLNWPDLSLIESVVPQVWFDSAVTLWKDWYINMLKNAKQMYIEQLNSYNTDKWVTFNPTSKTTTSTSPAKTAKAKPTQFKPR